MSGSPRKLGDGIVVNVQKEDSYLDLICDISKYLYNQGTVEPIDIMKGIRNNGRNLFYEPCVADEG